MSEPDSSADLAAFDDLARVVLDADGLDLLELALGGGLERLPPIPGVADGSEAILVDPENTPVARVHADRDDGTARVVEPLRPLAGGSGPAWDPTLRRTARDIRKVVRSAARDARVLAVVVDDAPSDEDIRRLLEAASAMDAVLAVAPVSRRHEPAAAYPAAARARLAAGLADTLKTARRRRRERGPVRAVAVPWPGDDRGGAAADATGGPNATSLEEVLPAFGATDVLRLDALRGTDTVDTLAVLASAFERAVGNAYPPFAVDEILHARQAGDRRASGSGAVVFFTGLSGSGKSTLARALADELADDDPRTVTLLDGDDVRRLLSADLGFDAASRDANIERIGYVASLVAAHGGIAIAAPIAPFDRGRRAARAMVEPPAVFVLVHVATPLEVCEARDRKGLYARARAGEIDEFTGISSPYEPPEDAEVVIDTSVTDVPTAVRMIRDALASALDLADVLRP